MRPVRLCARRAAQENPEAALAGLTIWGLVKGWLVWHGWSEPLLVSLGLGRVGTMAVVTISAH